MYLIIETNEVVSQGELRKRNPEISLPAVFDAETLDFLGAAVVFETPAPVVGDLEIAFQDGVEKDAKGNWVVKWSVRPMFADISENGTVVKTKADQEAEYVASKIAQIQASIITAAQARLDDFAKTRNYDGILSACTYATSTIAKFKAEGEYCVAQRDATWQALYAILADVNSSVNYADIEGDLPELVWPN